MVICMNRTVERAIRVLQVVSDNADGTTLQQIADALEMPKSSAYVIVQTLLSLNYLSTMKHNDKKYCLGIEVFSLGMKYVNGLDLVKQCALYLNPLAEKRNKTAFVGVLDSDAIVYIHKYVGKNAILASCALGSRKEVHATALGKAILAFLNEKERNRIIDRVSLKSVTEYSITDKKKFLEELALTRRRGYSLDIRESDTVTYCCGAPVFDHTGNIVAAISLSDIFDKNADQTEDALELKAVAVLISKSLGFNP